MVWDEINILESNILLNYFSLYLTNKKTFGLIELPAFRLEYFWIAGVAMDNTYGLLLLNDA